MKNPWALVFLLVGIGKLGAIDPPLDALLTAYSDQVFSGTLKSNQVLEGLTEVKTQILATSASDQQEALVQAFLIAGQFFIDIENKSQAESLFLQAEKYALEISKNPIPRNLALLVEVRTKFLRIKDVGFIISQAGAILEEAEKILQKEPNNLRALFVVAYGRLYSPSFFGGNPQRSKDLFEKILNLEISNKTVRFQAFLGLSEAWRKLGNPNSRQKALDQATKIYPLNLELKKVRVQN